jgi:hypothetical protein
MKSPGPHHAFILRIWWEGESQWRGWVQCANNQEERYIQDLGELLVFIQDRTGELNQQQGKQERK